MPRVSEETLVKLKAFLDTLPDYVRNKCALCNETLTHIVKTAEAQTGAGTATVTRELANRINDDAAPGGKPGGEALRQRVLEAVGEKTRICSIGTDNRVFTICPICKTEYGAAYGSCPNACDMKAHNHRAQGTGENEWYTPAQYIKMAVEVMGGIDLDPASSENANEVVCADNFFTISDNGLTKQWSGKVWLNPPYSQPAITDFANKVIDEWTSGRIESAIILTHNYTDTKWFHSLAAACQAICFTRGRIAFVNISGEKAAPTQGQAFFYFGNSIKEFSDIFRSIGFVVYINKGLKTVYV